MLRSQRIRLLALPNIPQVKMVKVHLDLAASFIETNPSSFWESKSFLCCSQYADIQEFFRSRQQTLLPPYELRAASHIGFLKQFN